MIRASLKILQFLWFSRKLNYVSEIFLAPEFNQKRPRRSLTEYFEGSKHDYELMARNRNRKYAVELHAAGSSGTITIAYMDRVLLKKKVIWLLSYWL